MHGWFGPHDWIYSYLSCHKQYAQIASFIALGNTISAIRRLHDKTSAADPIPTSVLRQTADVVAPFVTELFNRSLTTGHFPAAFKEAFDHSNYCEEART